MAECSKCRRDDSEVRLIDAISNTGIVKMCEDCASEEGIPLIRKPSTFQLKESEKSYTVRDRIRRMSGVTKEKEEVSRIAQKVMNVTLDELRKRKKEREMHERKEKERKQPLNLVDNFHWHIIMNRKKRKLTRNELAKLLGESETAIRMIEDKQLPEDALVLIRKLEQFFGVKLREGAIEKTGFIESEELNPLPDEIDLEVEDEKKPAKILKFDHKNINNLTIGDLMDMKKERERKERENLERLREQKGDVKVSDLIWQVKKEEREEILEKQEREGILGEEIEFEDG